MSFRAIVAILVDVVMTIALFLVTVVHIFFVVKDKNGDYVALPEYKMVIFILIVMGAVTVWWLLGRRCKTT